MLLSRSLKLLSLIALLLLIVVLVIALKITSAIEQPNTLTSPVDIELQRGGTIRSLAKQLHQAGVLAQPEYLQIWARFNGKAQRLKAGDYQLQAGISIAAFIDIVIAGKVKQYSLTLLEGWTFKQFMQAINQHPAIEHQLAGLTDAEIMDKIGYPGEHPEGRFFPDTYYIHKNISDVEVLQRAYKVMQNTLNQAWEKREENLPYKNPYEALIMASIVEKESAVAEERPQIAGVFINRLRINMRLQTDPTVIYGIGDDYDGNIRYRHLRTDTPYNTYTRKGLPPTPIAMPGRGAIQASLHPLDTKYLYFVAMNDNSGRHVFSSTLADHNKAVDIHQRKKKR